MQTARIFVVSIPGSACTNPRTVDALVNVTRSISPCLCCFSIVSFKVSCNLQTVSYRGTSSTFNPAFFSGDVQLGTLINGYGVDSNVYSVDENGKVVYNMVTEQFKAYLTMLHKWFQEGLIDMDMLLNGTVSPGEMNAYVTNGRAAMVSGEADFLSAASRALSEDENYDIIPIPDPTLEKNGTLRVGGDNGSSGVAGENGWSVNGGFRCD